VVLVVVGEQFAGGGDDDEEEVQKRNHARNFCLSEKGLVLRLWREVDCRERERTWVACLLRCSRRMRRRL
jgi:hypothetical protein